MKKFLIASAALALTACGGETATQDAGDAADNADAGETADTADTAEADGRAMLDGNEFNPQEGDDAGLPMGMRLFPGAELVSSETEGGATVAVFTSPEARPQVIDWYYRKLEARGFDIPAPGMDGFEATTADASVSLEATADNTYQLTISPDGPSG